MKRSSSWLFGCIYTLGEDGKAWPNSDVHEKLIGAFCSWPVSTAETHCACSEHRDLLVLVRVGTFFPQPSLLVIFTVQWSTGLSTTNPFHQCGSRRLLQYVSSIISCVNFAEMLVKTCNLSYVCSALRALCLELIDQLYP
jgi:hypothetical protein